MEIRNIFTTQIMDFFKENVPKNGEALREFCEALKNGDAKGVEKQLKENFRPKGAPSVYYGILLGILDSGDSWSVSSN